jgi:hypothetical protein
MFSYDEALSADPIVAPWIFFAPALGAHMYTLEDGPELPNGCGLGALEGGDILEGMYAQSCTTIEASRMRG